MSVNKGAVVIKSKPFVYILSSKHKDSHCEQCFKREKLLKCAGCQYVYYCDRNCQKESWIMHKAECSNLKRISPRILPDAARLLARIIVKLKNGGDEVKEYYSEKYFRKFKDLMTHYSEIKTDTRRMEHFTSLCGVLIDFMGETELPSAPELLGIYGRVCVNSFNILDQDMNSIGVGIYLGPSILDHSCKPNAVAVFEGTTIIIRTIEDIPNFNYTKLRISYTDVLNETLTRQKELKKTYYFLCECDRCRSTEPYANAAMCNSCCREINLKEISCLHCNKEISDDFWAKFNEVIEFTNSKIDSMASNAYLDVSKKCLSMQENLLHPLNIKHIRTIESAYDACIHLENWNEAEYFGLKLLPGFCYYYGEINPMTGLLYLMIGKIQLFINKEKLALENLKKAQEILSITHGDNHSLYTEKLRPLLNDALRECESER